MEAAREVFLSKGYRQATVKDIVTLADANVASINYHFGDKLTLFCAVLTDELQPLTRSIPRISDDPENPERALRNFVDWYLSRFRPGTDLALLLADVSMGICLEMMTHDARLELSVLCGILAALNPDASPEEIQRNAVCMMTLLIHGVRYDPHVGQFFTDSHLTPGARRDWSNCIAELCLQGVMPSI